MPLLDIDLVKKHLRVDDSDSDDIIEVYQAAAEASVIDYLDRDVYAPGDSPGPTDDYSIELKPAMTAAILLLIGDMYADRETEDSDFQRRPTVGIGSVFPRQVRSLLAPFRVWRNVSESASDYGYCA